MNLSSNFTHLISSRNCINQPVNDEERAKSYVSNLRCKECGKIISLKQIKDGSIFIVYNSLEIYCCDSKYHTLKSLVKVRYFAYILMTIFCSVSKEDMKILLSLLIIHKHKKFKEYVHHELANSHEVDDQIDFVYNYCKFEAPNN